MKQITTILLAGLAAVLFSGCTPTLPPEAPIPPAKQIKHVNHKLTVANQEKIEKDYVAYRDNLVTGVFSGTANSIEKSNYKVKNLDMSKEKLYQCNITRILGNPPQYFHKMFVISDESQKGKPFSVGLSFNNVNKIKYFDTAIYPHKDGGYGLGIVETSGLTIISGLNYKCELVKNTVFSPDSN